ncbi:MAG: gliding motility-associated-like protein, partial [Marinoscillum sp.]
TQPTCTVATGSVVLTGLPTGNWTINPGAITGATASTTLSGLAAGTTFNYTVTNAAGCISVESVDIVIEAQPVTPALPPIATITQPTCATATGSIVLSGLPTGNWTINPGAITGSTASITLSSLSAGTYSYTVTNAAGCTSGASADVVINAALGLPSAPTLGTITQPSCTVATGSVVLSGLPTGNWIINPGAITGSTSSTILSGLAATTYNFIVTNAAGCTSDPLIISIAESECDFNIPKGFSPNNDGINDKFVIRGIEHYPNNTMVIYNRWGNKVFKSSPYQNTWDGTSDFGLLVGGDQLPDGTYFCILDLGDGSEVYRSYVYIKK